MAIKYDNTYRPLFFRLKNSVDADQLNKLRQQGDVIFEFDEIERQLVELFRCQNPGRHIDSTDYTLFIEDKLDGIAMDEYGVWVYYPWRKALVHILDEKEFVQVRTNRNQDKVTAAENAILEQKTIAIIGLSVGQSVALTLAMERTCGSLRLADFDELDLSNLNRIRTGVLNLSLPKVVIAAREIAEIDPYLRVDIFEQGISTANIDSFLTDNGKVDVLVEVCDNFEIKILSRLHARAHSIPVVMDTNDRGMLDIERFDLEQDRPVLHGLAEGLDQENIFKLSPEERMQYLMRIVNASNLSPRMQTSIPQIGKKLISWPQLASEVVLGGAATTTACRHLLLGIPVSSGRYYIDLDQILRQTEDYV